MGKSTISMAIFNSYVTLPEGIYTEHAFQSPFRFSNTYMNVVNPMINLPFGDGLYNP